MALTTSAISGLGLSGSHYEATKRFDNEPKNDVRLGRAKCAPDNGHTIDYIQRPTTTTDVGRQSTSSTSKKLQRSPRTKAKLQRYRQHPTTTRMTTKEIREANAKRRARRVDEKNIRRKRSRVTNAHNPGQNEPRSIQTSLDRIKTKSLMISPIGSKMLGKKKTQFSSDLFGGRCVLTGRCVRPSSCVGYDFWSWTQTNENRTKRRCEPTD